MSEKKKGSPPTKARSQSQETASNYARSGVVSSSTPLKTTRESLAELERVYLMLYWRCWPHDLDQTKRLVRSSLRACKNNRDREIALCGLIIDASKQLLREAGQ